MNKLGVFDENQTSMPSKRLKPSSKIYLLTVPRRHLFCGSFVLLVLVFVLL